MVRFFTFSGALFHLFWCAFLSFSKNGKKAHQKRYNSQKLPGALGPLGALFYPAPLSVPTTRMNGFIGLYALKYYQTLEK